MSTAPPRFLCDHMLGSLAKWLRLLGYDTVYPGPLEDRGMAAKAYDEGRALLTRDKELAGRVKGSLFIASDDLDAQIKTVVERYRLITANTLTLCSVCNVAIVTVAKASVKESVPPAVFEIQSEFWRCPSCSRVYWRGSHWEAMLERIERFGGGGDSSPGQSD